MNAIILPIKHVFIEQIFLEIKRYEFRTRLCKNKVDKIILYETAPTKQIVGEVHVVEKLYNEKEALWEHCKDYAGITKIQYDEYFRSHTSACAYHIETPVRYKHPLSLAILGYNYPIQSFAYIDQELLYKNL